MPSYQINDWRTAEEKANTWGFVVATDSSLSGWGQAPGRSFFAVAVSTIEESRIVEENMQWRSEMKRVRVVGADWRPKAGAGDHLSIVGKHEASRFFEPGRFMPTSRYADLKEGG